jgi:hypothetical protein
MLFTGRDYSRHPTEFADEQIEPPVIVVIADGQPAPRAAFPAGLKRNAAASAIVTAIAIIFLRRVSFRSITENSSISLGRSCRLQSRRCHFPIPHFSQSSEKVFHHAAFSDPTFVLTLL